MALKEFFILLLLHFSISSDFVNNVFVCYVQGEFLLRFWKTFIKDL